MCMHLSNPVEGKEQMAQVFFFFFYYVCSGNQILVVWLSSKCPYSQKYTSPMFRWLVFCFSGGGRGGGGDGDGRGGGSVCMCTMALP